jgi:hypothetical protein
MGFVLLTLQFAFLAVDRMAALKLRGGEGGARA